MAVARTGSVSVLTNAANASSGNVTVPEGASLALVFSTGYYGTGTTYATPGAAPTLGGNTLTTAVISDQEELVKGGVWYLNNPPSGTQSLAWDWGGTDNSSVGGVYFVVYYTGTHASAPIGATVEDQASATSPFNAGALSNASNDLVVAFGWAFRSGSSPGMSWSNVTEVQDDTQDSGGGWASYADTAGTGTNITPSFTYTGDDVGLIGITILQAAGGGGGTSLRPKARMRMGVGL